jgi:crotonobetainyl-CoA:carnitine CoA-transferase CaiB-like acyl-CoA transferase
LSNQKPFKGLKVIEFASVLAGPLVGRFFAELGADVLKIEGPEGDVTRGWKNPIEKKETKTSSYFASANYGKTYQTLNLKLKSHQEEAQKICKTADIVLVNFKPGIAKSFRLDFENLKNLNPNLIYGEITGFEKGNNRPAFDMVLQAEAGYLSMSGFPEKPFAKMPVALIDVLASHQLKEGILIALLKREKINQAQKVSVSLIESAISSLVNQASNYLNDGFIPKPMGSDHPNIAPYGSVFYSKEKKPFLLAVGTNKQFKTLGNFLNFTEEVFENFSDNFKRVKNREMLNQLIQKEVSLFYFKELKSSFLKLEIPFGQIKSMNEVFENEENNQLIAQEIFEQGILKSVKTVSFKISN